MKNSTWWQMSRALAMVILRDREKRRSLVTKFLLFVVVYFAIGVWGINSWLEQSLFRMAVYWGFLVLMLLFLMFCALFDALAVIGEERKKFALSKPKIDEEISGD